MGDQHIRENHQDGKEVGALNPTEEVEEPKSITNIYYDCLERIFDFLDLESLLNVARTCKRLQIAAAAKFNDEHGYKKVWLSPMSVFHENQIDNQMDRNLIIVGGKKLCLPFLRCFGTKILKLKVDFKYNVHAQQDHLDQYINKYCSDTLTSIEFRNRLDVLDGTFSKPFKNVKKVKIAHWDLQDQLSNFVNWFPNLTSLKMYYQPNNKYVKDQVFDVPFPNLLHFRGYNTGFSKNHTLKFLHANPQLQSLDIGEEDINEEERTRFSQLNFFPNRLIADVIEINNFPSNHSLIEDLELMNYLFTADGAIMLIDKLESLTRFKFLIVNQIECDRFLDQLDEKWQHIIDSADFGTHQIVEIF